MITELVKYTDDRGTICIAQVGMEIPFAIRHIQYFKNEIIELSTLYSFTIIVIKGSLSLTTNRGNITIDEDHLSTFQSEMGPKFESISDTCIYIIVIHGKLQENIQVEKSNVENSSINDCITYSSHSKKVEYEPSIKNVQRLFYLKNVVKGETRGGHAHKYSHQGLIALDGSFSVALDDCTNQKCVTLSESSSMLYIPPYIFATEFNFTKNAICLVLASNKYDKGSYIDSIEELELYKDEIHR